MNEDERCSTGAGMCKMENQSGARSAITHTVPVVVFSKFGRCDGVSSNKSKRVAEPLERDCRVLPRACS